MEIRTEIEIDAPPALVWELLTDVEAYGEWNPHVIAAYGDLSVGSALDLTVRREGTADRTMTVEVTAIDPERRLEWTGKLLATPVFLGRHVFELEALDGGRTRLVNREEVSGLLAGVVTTDDPEVDYEAMNEALKRRAEQLAVRQAA